jgi:thiamine transport system substrate-binding protein
MRKRSLSAVVVAVAIAVAVAACGSDNKSNASGSSGSSGSPQKQSITIVTHDSFAVSDNVLKAFEDQSGITVNQVKSGDAGALVNQAILTKDHPQGDLLYGIDNTLLTKGLDAGLFEPYTSPALNNVDPAFDLDHDQHRVTPIDESDVCLNYDRTAFGGTGQPPAPTKLEDLTMPAFKDKVVVENPATSSPGLAFLVATAQHFGNDHYLDYWNQLKANGLKVVDGWDQAYNNEFSIGSAGTGTRTVVVSYATSPPADVAFANPPKNDTSVGVVQDSCFRQVEFAGVLKGTSHADAAHKFIDFMLSKQFQEDMPLQMYVYPVRPDAALPDVFTKFAVKPANPIELDINTIGSNRERWIDDWTSTVLG